jgi:putative ABC transport system ATP-binding protein
LFNAICGKFAVDAGAVILDGEDVTRAPDYKRALDIGRIQQDPAKGTAPGMTIEENLSLAYTRKAGKSFFAVSKRDRAIFSERLAALDMGLEARLAAKAGSLSGGQRQALALLMATIAEPKLLLLDEHTAALDPVAAGKVMAVTMAAARENKVTTLMITHDISEALANASRVLMMDAGQVILDISGDGKKNLTVAELLRLYNNQAKKELATDRILMQ